MALIKCPECGREISDKATACPGCGCPVVPAPEPEAPPEQLAPDAIQATLPEQPAQPAPVQATTPAQTKRIGCLTLVVIVVVVALIMAVARSCSGGSDGIRLRHGKLLDTTVNGSTLVIKAKIEPSLSDEMTINQNYYNVCDIIRNQGGDQYSTISYWAVADMTSGEEAKVISFDVPASVIARVAKEDFPDNTLGDLVDDLWIHPSLTD